MIAKIASKIIYRIVLLFTLMSGTMLLGQDALPGNLQPFLLQEGQMSINLLDATGILIEEEEDWTIEEILDNEPSLHFAKLTDTVYFGPHKVWLKLRLEAQEDIENMWLIFRRSGDVVPFITRHEKADCYFVKNGVVERHVRSGYMVPASQKDIKDKITVTRFNFNLKKDELISLYIRVETTERLFPILEVRNPELGLPSVLEGTPFWGIVVLKHFMIIIGIYIFFLYQFVKDHSYLYLLGMIGFLLIHYHILLPYSPFISWVIPEHPAMVEIFWNILTLGSFIFYFQFGRTYTNLSSLNRKLDNYVIWFIGFLAMLIVLRIVFWVTGAHFWSTFYNLSSITCFLLGLGLIFRLAFIKNVLVRYYVFGGGWMVFFSIIGLLWNNQLIPFFNNPNPWIVAQGGFILINALAIGRKMQLSERAKLEIEKVKEIDAVKSRFFANISHEFRTPLSLILGPVNQSLENIPATDDIDETMEIPVKGTYLQLIKRNTLRLQNLVDQILDLAKLDKSKLKLKIKQGDIIQFIRAIVFSFESVAEQKHIHLNTSFPESENNTYYDSDKLEKIIVNLLSNAFKFTPQNGTVSVSVTIDRDRLKVMISDTGTGMDSNELGHVFERFYQVESTRDTGTGIGLSLVKELVELHGGQIGVDSQINVGTSFKISLPFRRESFQDDVMTVDEEEYIREMVINPGSIFHTAEQLSQDTFRETDLPLALVVEDNPDLLYYITESIKSECTVIQAEDGQRGIDLAIERIPDIIISDVMMPRKNGYQLCDTIKKDERTDHIPILLLTAKAEREDKIIGLSKGADDYLVKPFDRKELVVRIANLLETRRKLRERYAKEFKMNVDGLKVSSVEHRFLNSVKEVIEREMNNEFFTVEELAKSVGFSRSQLARKIKSLTGKTSNQLIREFRLDKAKSLIEQNSGTISEIAYEVGYSNLSYFSKSYKEHFGVLPSETGR